MSGLQALVENNNAAVRRMEAIAPILCEWFDRELMQVHSQMPQKNGGLLMGCPVWGDDYIRRMALYSLPTLGSDRNITALSGRCWMVFYCQTGDRPAIWRFTRWLRQMGVYTILREIPDELIALANTTPEDRYGLLSAAQNVLAHMAGHAGMALHMYMPDHLYAEGYFERLLALGAEHEAIVQQGLSVNAATAPPAIERWRQDSGCLAIPDRELGRIVLDHLHPRSGMLCMNEARIPDLMPDSRQTWWRGRDAIHIADSCQNLIWLSPELCLDAPIAFTSTLDMLAPEYVRGSFYVPAVDDGLTFCELSDAGRIPPEGYVGLDRFLFRAWSQVAFTDDYLPYLERRSVFPIPEQDDYLADDEIERQHEWVLMALRSGKQQAMETYFAAQHPSRWMRGAA